MRAGESLPKHQKISQSTANQKSYVFIVESCTFSFLVQVTMNDPNLATRIADFLERFPPFSYLPSDGLHRIAATVHIKYFMEGEYVFRQQEPAGSFIYILHKGQVELYADNDGQARLVDVCDDGDVFGSRSILTGNPYLSSARVVEDALIYAIPKVVFKENLEAHPHMALFFAAGYASGQTVVREENREQTQARKQLLRTEGAGGLFREEDVLSLDEEQELIVCFAQNTIQEAAAVMKEYKIGSLVVINEKRFPIGIVTTVDFTRKVVAETRSRYNHVREIMSSPPITIAKGETVASIILAMMRHNIRHLVVTEDGTPQSPVIGVVSERDVLLMGGNHPAVLVKRILKSKNIDELHSIRVRADKLIQGYLRQEVSIPFIAEMNTEINDALITQAIDMAREKLEKDGMMAPALRFAWLSLGSEGRGEQLLRTDQDNALLYEDPPAGKEEAAREYFLALGKLAGEYLIHIGFERCPADIMAGNPKWNMSLSAWKNQFTTWLRVPEPKALMHGTIFFDFRCGYGDELLTEELQDFLREAFENHRGVERFFAQNALENPPPLSFFKNFMVEQGGDHKNKFDIKLRSMMPLCDAARILCLSKGLLQITNTFRRFERLADEETAYASLFREAAMAYEILMRFRALNGFEQQDSGRYIDPKSLNKIERQTLKTTFGIIERVQSAVRSTFSLNMFG